MTGPSACGNEGDGGGEGEEEREDDAEEEEWSAFVERNEVCEDREEAEV